MDDTRGGNDGNDGGGSTGPLASDRILTVDLLL